MTRRFGVWIVAALAAMVLVPIAVAQQGAKTYRVGWLGTDDPSSVAGARAEDFKQGLRDLKYVEGKNLTLEYRHASGNAERLPELAGDLVRLRVDVIVTSGEPAALAAKRATTSIPIVATEFGRDPVKAGLVASLGRPGGNVTGLATQSDELWQKRLALLKEVIPRIVRLAVVRNPADPGNASCVEEIKAAAPGLGLEVSYLEVKDASVLERAFEAAAGADAMAICWDGVTLARARAIANYALKQRMPTLSPFREYVQAGALLSFGASLSAQGRRAAYYVDKILKGTKPADLPIERPTLFELVVNVTTAKMLGLTLPPGLVVLADDLIQ